MKKIENRGADIERPQNKQYIKMDHLFKCMLLHYQIS